LPDFPARPGLAGGVRAPASSGPFLDAVRAAVNKANQHEAAEKK